MLFQFTMCLQTDKVILTRAPAVAPIWKIKAQEKKKLELFQSSLFEICYVQECAALSDDCKLDFPTH